MPFGSKWRNDPDDEIDYVDDAEIEEGNNYLSDMLDTQSRIETLMAALVEQGDKQIEFLSRLTTLFERAAKGQ